MTKITLKTEYRCPALYVNGRLVAFDSRITNIRNTSAGRWEGETNFGDTFTIIGGRASGGASNEWFVHYPTAYGDAYLPVKSAVQAINYIERI